MESKVVIDVLSVINKSWNNARYRLHKWNVVVSLVVSSLDYKWNVFRNLESFVLFKKVLIGRFFASPCIYEWTNEKNIYKARLKAYKCMLNLPRLAEN